MSIVDYLNNKKKEAKEKETIKAYGKLIEKISHLEQRKESSEEEKQRLETKRKENDSKINSQASSSAGGSTEDVQTDLSDKEKELSKKLDRLDSIISKLEADKLNGEISSIIKEASSKNEIIILLDKMCSQIDSAERLGWKEEGFENSGEAALGVAVILGIACGAVFGASGPVAAGIAVGATAGVFLVMSGLLFAASQKYAKDWQAFAEKGFSLSG